MTMDGRSENDNTKEYRIAKVKKNSVLVEKAVQLLVSSKQKINPSSVSRTINEYFNNEGTITAAGIRKNSVYMGIIEKHLLENFHEDDPAIQGQGMTIAEFKKDKYRLTIENSRLTRENSILKKIIKQENIPTSNSQPVVTSHTNKVPIDVVKDMLKLLLASGECYVKGENVYKEEDGSILLTKDLYKHLRKQ